MLSRAFLLLSLFAVGEAFVALSGSRAAPTSTTKTMMIDPATITTAASDFEADYGDIAQSALIVLTLGGGLIPSLFAANSGMMKALSGRKGYIPEGEEPGPGVETFENFDPNNTFDPTMGDAKNIKFREYVIDSGATGPELPNRQFLFAADPIPIADIVAVLGRIENKDSLTNWRDLPSTKRGTVTPGYDPPMWLPRAAFKVQIRKNRFLGWPNDPKTGLPVGGEELKRAEEKRIAKNGALIGDAALDAVFDSWSGGASVATPDKVEALLNKIKLTKTEFDLDAFAGAAVLGRANTAFAALTFVIIQVIAFGALFAGPMYTSLTGQSVSL